MKPGSKGAGPGWPAFFLVGAPWLRAPVSAYGGGSVGGGRDVDDRREDEKTAGFGGRCSGVCAETARSGLPDGVGLSSSDVCVSMCVCSSLSSCLYRHHLAA